MIYKYLLLIPILALMSSKPASNELFYGEAELESCRKIFLLPILKRMI